MNKAEDFFIEVDCAQLSEMGQSVSGDVYLQRRTDNRTITVLSDGSGSGIKANVIASVIASMAINYTHSDEPVVRAAKAVVGTFARGERKDDIKQATFTIIDIRHDGQVKIVEFENPPVVVMRHGKVLNLDRKLNTFILDNGVAVPLFVTEFKAELEDRIISYTDGLTLSGYATKRLPGGWGCEGLLKMLLSSVAVNSDISAQLLCRNAVSHAEMNDLFVVKNDMSCASVYFRKPRKVLVVTGPPFDDKKDKLLASTISSYEGSTVICGGTTSQIVARELGREISVVMKRDASGLPPASTMDGISLITEGVLTLGRVKVLLESMKSSRVSGSGLGAKFVDLLLEHDIIEFMVGTRINAIHQDPTLPVELELRRNVIKDIARLLELKFMKRVNVIYI